LPTAAFYTLGCKVNQHDSNAIMQAFVAAGFTITEPQQLADIYIVNSCAVTAAGEKKSLQALRRFRRQAPDALIVLCGCFAQAFPEKAKLAAQADIVLGSKNRGAVLGAVTQKLAGKEGRLVDIPEYTDSEPFEDLAPPGVPVAKSTRAFLKIQDGCSRQCAYCIVPTARGPVRSKPLGDIRKDLEKLAAAGHKEAVLAGVNLCCYGHDLSISLIDALETALDIPGLSRIRFGSLEPDMITDDDISRMAQLSEKNRQGALLCDQFHICLQSGNDRTLRRMNRQYDTALYRSVAQKLRDAFPGCAITTDLIVGFPGESDDDHRASLDFVREIGFARAHIFVYSPRPGTPAADLPERIPAHIASRRAKEMGEVAEKGREAFLRTRIGKVYPVLFESEKDGFCFGHTPCYTPVWIRSAADIRGEVLNVRMTELREGGCVGVVG